MSSSSSRQKPKVVQSAGGNVVLEPKVQWGGSPREHKRKTLSGRHVDRRGQLSQPFLHDLEFQKELGRGGGGG